MRRELTYSCHVRLALDLVRDDFYRFRCAQYEVLTHTLAIGREEIRVSLVEHCWPIRVLFRILMIWGNMYSRIAVEQR